jgi:O-antigen/teichoic acid export membrane protein
LRKLDLFTRTGLVSLGQSVAKLAQIVVALVLVRLLGPDEWAAMALLLSIYIAGIGIGALNIHQGIYFFYGRIGLQQRRTLVLQTSSLLAASGLLTGLVVLALVPVLDGGPYDIAPLLPWLALALVVEMPAVGGAQFLLAAERAGAAALYDASMAILQVAALSLPVALGWGLEGSVRALVLYAAARLLVFTVVMSRSFPGPRTPMRWALLREQIVYTAPLGLAIATAVLNRNVDKWFVAAFDPDNFGAYAIAAQEVPLIAILPNAISAVLATRLVHAFMVGRLDRVRQYWLAQTSNMALVVVPATIGLLLCAEELIVVLFTSQYAIATLPFQIYTVILLHRVAEYGLVLRAAGDTRSLWWASFLLLFGNVVLSLPLTWALGMLGAALGTLVANLVAWLYILRRIARVIGTTVREAFPWGRYGRILALASLAGMATAFSVGAFDLPPVPRLLAKVLIYALLVLGLLRGAALRGGPSVPEDDEDFHDRP